MEKISNNLELVLLLLIHFPLLVTAKGGKSQQWDGAYILVLCLFFFLVATTTAYLIRRFGCFGLGTSSSDTATDPLNNQPPMTVPCGLDAKAVEALPSLFFSEVKMRPLWEGDQLECSVCLNEFKDQDILRLLPGCLHVFHPHCIAPWLASHVTCPLCRASMEHSEESSVVSISDDQIPASDQRHGDQYGDHDHVITLDIEGHEGSSSIDSSDLNVANSHGKESSGILSV